MCCSSAFASCSEAAMARRLRRHARIEDRQQQRLARIRKVMKTIAAAIQELSTTAPVVQTESAAKPAAAIAV